MNQIVIGTNTPPGGFGGAGAPPMCRPPFFLVVLVEWSESKSCFDLAENCGASSLWVGVYRYTRISCASKLLWV